jgi:hypothetical protein
MNPMMIAVHSNASVVKMVKLCGYCNRGCFYDKIKEQNNKFVGFGECSQQSVIPIAALVGLTDNLALAIHVPRLG